MTPTRRTRNSRWFGPLALTAFLMVLAVPFVAGSPAGAADAPLRCMGQVPTIVGTGGNDALNGTSGPDVIAGLEGNDVLRGFGGNDVLCGGDGSNIYDAGPGYDVMAGGSSDDSFYGGDGDDEVSYQGSYLGVTADLRNRVASGQGSDVFSSIENLIGSPWNDYLVGDSANNRLVGMAGSDFVWGNEGEDILADQTPYTMEVNQLIGGPGYDILYGGKATDVANFGGSPLGVTVDLATGVASGEGTDQMSGIDDVVGTVTNDVIRGNSAANNLNGNGGEDRIFGSGGNDTIEGNTGNDELHGEAGIDRASFANGSSPIVASLVTGTATGDGSDTLDGFEGLIGAAGNDQLTGGPTNDSLAGGGGDDRLDGAGGTDMADFDGALEPIVADLQTGRATGDGTDTLLHIEDLRGGTQADDLFGNSGPNRLVGDHLDLVDGRQGDDILDIRTTTTELSFGSAKGPVTVDLDAGTATGAGNDRILGEVYMVLGGPYGDTITCQRTGRSCNVDAGAGNDVLNGSPDGDYFKGGTGNDRLLGKGGTDAVSYNLGAPVVVDLPAGTATGQGTDTLGSIERVVGSNGNDRITAADRPGCSVDGSQGNDVIRGASATPCVLIGSYGDDTITGGSANDEIYAWPGRDVVRAGAGDDEMEEIDGNDDFDGGPGVDAIDLRRVVGAGLRIDLAAGTVRGALTMTLTGFENVQGSGYDDTISGTEGPNVIDGYLGKDTIFGAGGDDTLTGGSGEDWIHGLAGDDTIDGGIYSDTMYGGSGTDTVVFGANGPGVSASLVTMTAVGYAETDAIREFENITGSSGNDTLVGDAGPNVLDGRGGTDTCTGGGGADTVQNCP